MVRCVQSQKQTWKFCKCQGPPRHPLSSSQYHPMSQADMHCAARTRCCNRPLSCNHHQMCLVHHLRFHGKPLGNGCLHRRSSVWPRGGGTATIWARLLPPAVLSHGGGWCFSPLCCWIVSNARGLRLLWVFGSNLRLVRPVPSFHQTARPCRELI